jgi:hypothetical protein
MNAIEGCVFVFPFFCLCDLAGNNSNEWRAHSKLIGRAHISPFYWTVVVGSHPDKLKGTDK